MVSTDGPTMWIDEFVTVRYSLFFMLLLFYFREAT